MKIFGDMVQLYTTGRYEMHCPECSVWQEKSPEMNIKTFRGAVRCSKDYGVSRIGLFAKDPLLNSDILGQVEILNESGLYWELLTVGSSPTNADVEKLLMRVIKVMDRTRGGLVLSVDLAKNRSKKILAGGGEADLWPYAYKADTFRRLAPIFKDEGIKIRTNTVISSNNYGEVPEIMEEVAEMGFAVSFCRMQTVSPEFFELLQEGLTLKKEKELRSFLEASGNLDTFQIEQIIKESREIINRGELNRGPGSPFNKFRSWNPEESLIPPIKLEWLKQRILNLKKKYDDRVLPGEDFIMSLGKCGIGCRDLMKQEKFPQLKIFPFKEEGKMQEGRMWFCCDMHDKYTESYSVDQFYEYEIIEAFLAMEKRNSYRLLCQCFFPCSFSVNHVGYAVKGAEVNGTNK